MTVLLHSNPIVAAFEERIQIFNEKTPFLKQIYHPILQYS